MSKQILWLTLGALSVGFAIASCSSSSGAGATGGGGDGAGGDGEAAGADTGGSSTSGTTGSGGADAQAGSDSGTTGGVPSGDAGSASTGGVTGEGGVSDPGFAGAPTGDAGAGGAGGVTRVECLNFKNCEPGQYCHKKVCGDKVVGFCADGEPGSPVCGCDGITYYDGAMASAAEVAVQARGICAPKLAVACDGKCAVDGQTCGLVEGRAGDCQTKVAGICWQLPKECPQENAAYGYCAADKCLGLCEAVQSGEHFVLNPLACAIKQ